MWRSHPTQQDLLLSSGQLLSKVAPFLQMQHDTTGKLFHRVFINWWDFNPLKSNWKIQTQSLATVTEGYGLWNLIMRSSRTPMYRWYRGAASITRGVHCADPKLIHSDRTSESEFKWHVMVGPFRVTQCSIRCWGICENAQSISRRESKSLICLSWQKAIRHERADCASSAHGNNDLHAPRAPKVFNFLRF